MDGDDPPVAMDQTAQTVSPAPVTIDLTVDANGDPATSARIVTAPPVAQGTARISGTNAIFAPAASFAGTSTFTFALSNEFGTSNAATARVTVTKPFEVRTLNPFYTHPSGATSADLAKISREIDSPGGFPGTNPSGPAQATKIATDGVSRIVIGLKTWSRSPATVSIVGDAPGSLIPLTTALFRAPAGGRGPITLSSFTPASGGNGAMTAGVAYVAPETPQNFPGLRAVTIRIEQDGQTKDVALALVPPPVLLVHGIWSGPGAWQAWGSLSGSFPAVDRANYGGLGWVAFDAPAVQNSVKTSIETLLDQTRNKGVVAAQVSLIGHSMGGLVSRVFANDTARWKPANFMAGFVNAIITINTPHQGSALAQKLWDYAPRRIVLDPTANVSSPSYFLLRLPLSGFVNPRVSEVFTQNHQPISGSVDSLRPTSSSLSSLSRAGTRFPYEAISTYDDSSVPSELELKLNMLLRLLSLPTIDSILGPQNDVIVALASQRQGGTPQPEPFPGLIHTNNSSTSPISVLNSPRIVSYVTCRLLNKPNCRTATGAVAMAEPAAARVPVDGFSLAGLRRISDSNLALSGIPATGLVPNTGRVLTPASASSARRLTHFLALIDDGNSNWFSGDNVNPKIRLTTTSLKPITVRIVATFSDRTFASRSFTLRPNAGFTIRSLSFDDAVIRIQRGATFPLALTAGLNAPATGSLDVTANAVYSPKPNSTGIARVSSSGILTAVAPGTMWVRGSYKGRNAYTTIIVGP